MILVDASWEDESGALHTTRACMEDKSVGGACFRVKTPIPIGSKLRIQWHFERFAGIVKYCRPEGREFVVGIEREAFRSPTLDSARSTVSTRKIANASEVQTEIRTAVQKFDPPVLTQETKSQLKPQAGELVKIPMPVPTVDNQPILRITNAAAALPRGFGRVTDNRERPGILRTNISQPSIAQRVAQPEFPHFPDFDARQIQLQAKQPPKQMEAGRERKPMGRKWLQPGTWHAKPDVPTSREEKIINPREKEISMPHVTQPAEKDPSHSAREVPNFQVELLPTEEIYTAAGILSPRRGYSVNKVVEMLNSVHIRSLSKEMRRAAVLMALDAAGISTEQIQRDAKARQDALDYYEAEQKRQAEAEWARKAEAIAQIQAELESIKAHYTGRINRNLESVARDKARFSNWVATKQHETQSMAEAVELCLKSPPPEPVIGPAPETNLAAGAAAGAGGKL